MSELQKLPPSPSAPEQIFYTLLETSTVLALGSVSVQFNLVSPERGDMAALRFYLGRVALPLLIFKTVALAELQSIDWGVVLACNLGKLVVLLATWLIVMAAYQSEQYKAKKLLTATTFAFFTIASDDFAIGLPIIHGMYANYPIDISVYIAANALIMWLVFMPLIVTLFEIGQAQLTQQELSAKNDSTPNPSVHQRTSLLPVAREIILNPVIVCTVSGCAYKLCLGWTLSKDDAKLVFPAPLRGIIDLLTSGFRVLALFLTGTALRSPSIGAWASALVLMKVVVCAYITFGFGKVLVRATDTPQFRGVLQDFAFFYGSIPSSSAPLVFAAQFDPGSSELLATAVLLGLLLAAPNMFLTSLFTQNSGTDMTQLLRRLQLSMNFAGVVCGLVLVILILLVRRHWGWRCQVKQLLALYAFITFCYELVVLVLNPDIHQGVCPEVSSNHMPRSPLVFLMGYFQNTCRFLLIYLQYIVMCVATEGPKHGDKTIQANAACKLVVCCLIGVVPALMVRPNTINEICRAESTSYSLIFNISWSSALLLSMAFFWFTAVSTSRLRMRSNRRDEELADLVGNPDRLDTQHVHSQATPPFFLGKNIIFGSDWLDNPPVHITKPLLILQGVRFVMQIVNASSTLASWQGVTGIFTQMLILEAILEHSQPIALLLVLLFDNAFAQHCEETVGCVLGSLPGKSRSPNIPATPGSPLSKTLPAIVCNQVYHQSLPESGLRTARSRSEVRCEVDAPDDSCAQVDPF